MRFIVAFVIGTLITLLVFVFMQSLVKNRYTPTQPITEFTDVAFIKAKPKPYKPEHQIIELSQGGAQPERQPQMPTLEKVSLQAISPLPSDIVLSGVPEPLDLTTGIEGGVPVLATIAAAGEGYSLVPGKGNVEKGTVALRPFAAVRPNIPLLAYQRRINGYVIVGYTVTAGGKVTHVKVLDGHPRGVFEDEAVKAVLKWVYPVNEEGNSSRVTQRLEFEWKNFKENIKE